MLKMKEDEYAHAQWHHFASGKLMKSVLFG
jgi:hypothetical protein